MEDTNTIYHIVIYDDLRTHTTDGYYTPENFAKDGFIHCTAGKSSSMRVLEDYFGGVPVHKQILVLAIGIPQLESTVRFEPPAPVLGVGSTHAGGGVLFPHIYGKLNLDAISGAGLVERTGNTFMWPREFRNVSFFLE